MTPHRIALVGCGRWGRHVLRDLLALGCAVTVVDSDDTSRSGALAGGASASVRRLGEARSAGGVIIATPATTHVEIVEEALELGVPVFCEKPFVLCASDAHRLAARGAGRLFVMDKWRYHQGIEALRDLAASPSAGEIIALETTRIGTSPPQVDVDPVWSLAPHDLAIAQEILGSIPAPATATAERATDGVSRRVVGLRATLGRKPRLSIEVSGASPVTRREVRLRCSGLTASLRGAMADHLLVSRHASSEGKSTASRVAIGVEPPLLRELRAFVDHLSGGPAPRSSAEDAALAISVLQALRQMAGIDDAHRIHDELGG